MKSEENAGLLARYIELMSGDPKIKAIHMAIIMAIFHIAIETSCFRTVQISRRQVMGISHIKSIATYHRYLKELVLTGYLKYEPSYHPKIGSKAVLCL
ncbi:hypothetical protein [Pedobacter sp. MR22-3]|uniref:hypothetical protein n=1 Tax=Pedobacter sp. MR22-3 TaxID=2994552 RepID=UPI002247EACD|nr:hypothetical protein [Pedobacter sp. MR22-3]MCX2583955.1 hypothetical protein [Pedobacter sp. MR22-3]